MTKIKGRATIYEIARLAGVSPKTVSRVLNDEPHVKGPTRDKVKALAAELHYTPNITAKGLITRRSFLIGLSYERPSPSYVVELQRGVLAALADERYRMVVLPFPGVHANPDGFAAFLTSMSLDGVVLAPPGCDEARVLDRLDAAGIAYGRVTPQHHLERGAVALHDDTAAARDIAAYMIGLGHRLFGVILGDPTHAARSARLAGTIAALEAHGIHPRSLMTAEGDFTFASGEAAMRTILARGEPLPTAIIAQNDDMAVGAMIVAREAGIDVPGQMAFVGFDGSEIGNLVVPRLTTVRQPVSELAQAATTGLLALLDGRTAPAPQTCAYDLLLRQSSGPPAA